MSIGKVTGGGPKIIINEALKKTFFVAFWIQLPVTYPTAPKPTALLLITCSTILNLLESNYVCSVSSFFYLRLLVTTRASPTRYTAGCLKVSNF
jgi:hypothetical protein